MLLPDAFIATFKKKGLNFKFHGMITERILANLKSSHFCGCCSCVWEGNYLRVLRYTRWTSQVKSCLVEALARLTPARLTPARPTLSPINYSTDFCWPQRKFLKQHPEVKEEIRLDYSWWRWTPTLFLSGPWKHWFDYHQLVCSRK